MADRKLYYVSLYDSTVEICNKAVGGRSTRTLLQKTGENLLKMVITSEKVLGKWIHEE